MEMIQIFDGINPAEKDEMLECFGAVVRKYKAGAVILSYSPSLQHVCVVLSGTVEVSCLDVDGNMNVAETLESNDVFGELFALPTGSLLYTVTAKTGCEVLFIGYEHIVQRCERICRHHNQLINNLFMLSARKSQMLSRRIAVLSQKTLRQKLLLYLEYMSAEAGASRFELPLPLSKLAEYLSADRSAMMRELGRMRSEGIIRQTGREFELLAVGGEI